MSSTTQVRTHGLGFAGALTILFVALKILGKIDWSWWWVVSPVWISAAVVFVVAFAVALVFAVVRR